MERRSFIKSLAVACLGPLLSPDSRIDVNAATTNVKQTQSEIFDDFACVIGLGEYGRRAIEALSLINRSNMHFYEYSGTISQNLNNSLKDGLFTFILSNPKDTEELRHIDRIMRLSRANSSFTILVSPNSNKIQDELNLKSYSNSFIAPSTNKGRDRTFMEVLYAINGIFIPFCGEYNPIPCLHICDLMHIGARKSSSVHFGYSDTSLFHAFNDALTAYRDNQKTIKFAYISVLSPYNNDVLALCDYVGEYSQYFECEQDLLWSWTKASLFGRNFTVVVYMYEEAG